MKAKISVDTVVVVSKEHFSCNLGDEVAVLNLRNGVYYGLNSVGTKVWSFIHAPKTVIEIQEFIMQAYDVSGDRCQSHIISLLQEMYEENLIGIV